MTAVDCLVLIALVAVLLYLVTKASSKKPAAGETPPKLPPAKPSTPLPSRLLPAHEERDLLAQRLRELTHEHDTLRERARTLVKRARASSEEVAALREENARLRVQLEEQGAAAPERAPEPEADVQPDPEPAAAPSSPARSETEAAEAVGAAFVAWCRRGGPLVGRYFMFERALQHAVPEASVSPVYRDAASARAVFREAADGPEHWLVRLGTARLLLPQPQSAAQFRELAPIFEGEATPQGVSAVVPARLAADGGLLVLESPGSVH